MAQWLSWLERRPVTAKVESSSLFWVVSNELTSLVNCIWIWNLSSAGRASALQAEGHRFEPYWSHLFAGVAELADAQDLKSCGTYTPVPVPTPVAGIYHNSSCGYYGIFIRTCSSAG